MTLSPVYNLNLFNSIKQDNTALIANITDMALNWRRSIRWQGGYWMGSFKLIEPESVLLDFFYQARMAHLEETSPHKTWEGMIGEMDLDLDRGELTATVLGYIHTANDRFVSASGATANASVWIQSLVGTDCEFLSTGRIKTNTLQVQQETDIQKRVWDEILRITEYGDGTNPWRVYVYNDRKLNYEVIGDVTPRYFTRGGIIKRWTRSLMVNHVSGTYIDTDNEVQTLAAAYEQRSIDRYGRKEWRILRHNIAQTAAEALRTSILTENKWPWARTLGGSDIELFSTASAIDPVSQWQVKPGIARDLSYPAGGTEGGGWFGDVRDFIISEVVAGPGGLRVKSEFFEDADLLLSNLERLDRMQDDEEEKKGSKRTIRQGRGTGYTRAEWAKLSSAERRAARARARRG